jgi:hypothetical protein
VNASPGGSRSRSLCALLAGVAVLSFCSDVSARQRPDFSGEWTIEAPTGGRGGRGGGRGAAADMGNGWGRTITITQDDARLTVEYTFFSRGDLQPPLKFRYALDGSSTTNTVLMGRGMQETVAITSWDGDTLVITTTHDFTDPRTGAPATVEVVRRLRLDSPSALRVETRYGSALGGPSSTTQTTYTRG